MTENRQEGIAASAMVCVQVGAYFAYRRMGAPKWAALFMADAMGRLMLIDYRVKRIGKA